MPNSSIKAMPRTNSIPLTSLERPCRLVIESKYGDVGDRKFSCEQTDAKLSEEVRWRLVQVQ